MHSLIEIPVYRESNQGGPAILQVPSTRTLEQHGRPPVMTHHGRPPQWWPAPPLPPIEPQWTVHRLQSSKCPARRLPGCQHACLWPASMQYAIFIMSWGQHPSCRAPRAQHAAHQAGNMLHRLSTRLSIACRHGVEIISCMMSLLSMPLAVLFYQCLIWSPEARDTH